MIEAAQPPDALRTPRLRLRPPEAGDTDVVLGLHQDPQAIEHNPGDALAGRDEALQLLQRWRLHWDQHGAGYWMVTMLEDSTVIGVCGVKAMNLHSRPVWNLLYRLHPSAWGHGVATEAADAVLGDVHERRPGRPVIARVRPDNHASAAVAIKIGLLRAPELDTAGEDGIEHIYLAPAQSTS